MGLALWLFCWAHLAPLHCTTQPLGSALCPRRGGGATSVSSLAMVDLCCCGGVAAGGYPAGAQEGTQFSRKVCPWGVRLAGLIGLYILLCFQQRSFRKHDLGQCATQSVSECSQRTCKLLVTVLQCSEAQSRRLETFIAS